MWGEGVVVPIDKRGEGEVMEKYRGVTLMPTFYKVYVTTLVERIRWETEEKGIIPHNLTGFRKGMRTINNICVLNYIINKQLGKKVGKLIALFIDIKAAFDSVDREMLMEAMRNRGVREELERRLEKQNWVRIGGIVGEEF